MTAPIRKSVMRQKLVAGKLSGASRLTQGGKANHVKRVVKVDGTGYVFPARVNQAVVRELALHLPSPPSANTYWRHNRGRTHLSAEAKAYRIAVYEAYVREFRTTRVAFPEGLLNVQIVWTRPRKIGDLDNITKQLFDSLRGVVYGDDKQIIEFHAFRRDGPNPGVQIVVSRTTESAAFTSPTYEVQP